MKHRLADLYVQVQAARSAAYYAAWAAGAGPSAGGGPAGARPGTGSAAPITGAAIQLHGGIGFTWEHQAHLYFKRAVADELLFGPVTLWDRAAQPAGLFAAVTAGG